MLTSILTSWSSILIQSIASKTKLTFTLTRTTITTNCITVITLRSYCPSISTNLVALLPHLCKTWLALTAFCNVIKHKSFVRIAKYAHDNPILHLCSYTSRVIWTEMADKFLVISTNTFVCLWVENKCTIALNADCWNWAISYNLHDLDTSIG